MNQESQRANGSDPLAKSGALHKSDQPMGLSGPIRKVEPSNLKAVRCYHCYNPQVQSICHHCGRFMCAKCQANPAIWLAPFKWLFADRVFARLRPLPTPKLRQAAHCAECYHLDLKPGIVFTLLGGVFLVLALIDMSLNQAWLRSAFWLIGAIGSGLAAWLGHRFLPYLKKEVHGFPLFSKITIEFKERLAAHFDITGGPYLTHDEMAQGTVQVKLGLKPHNRELYENTRLRRPSPNERITLHAGFVGLEILKHVRKLHRFRHNLLLPTTRIQYARFVGACNQSQELELTEQPYEVPVRQALKLNSPDHKEFPVLIRPRLVKGGRRLEIALEVVERPKLAYPSHDVEDRDKPVKTREGKPMLERLELTIPKRWKIIDTDGQIDTTEAMKVIWRKKVLDTSRPTSIFIEFDAKQNAKQQHQDDQPNSMNGHSPPAAAMPGLVPQPNGVEPTGHPTANEIELLSGNYEVTIENWTISQLQVARENYQDRKPIVYPANGVRIKSRDEEKDLEWLKPTIKYTSTFTGEVRIDPAYLSTQQVQAISDVLIEEDPQAEITSKERLPVAPSYHIVNEVVDALTAEQIFIKQVRESSGYLIEAEGGGWQVRYWEIRGRYYPNNGLQSVALHLVVTGDEPRTNQPNCQGALSFELSLRNYVDTEHCDQSQSDLKLLHVLLQQIIRQAIYRGRQVDYEGRRMAGWRYEQQTEQHLQSQLGEDTVAAILTPNGHTKQGHLFLLADETEIPPDMNERWHIHPVEQLPRSRKTKSEWIDKWELLRQVKEEHKNGTTPM